MHTKRCYEESIFRLRPKNSTIDGGRKNRDKREVVEVLGNPTREGVRRVNTNITGVQGGS